MSKPLLVVTVISCLLPACASILQKSMYPSGWNAKVNESTYSTCGIVRHNEKIFIPQNVVALRNQGLLTADEAARVEKAAVKVGDSECMAYASYGMMRGTVSKTSDRDGRTIERSVKYLCSNSPAPCPGVLVTFRDGRVSAIQQVAEGR